MAKQPRSRDDFQIAIICALALEADMVQLVLDKDWADDGRTFGKAAGDQNSYTTGLISNHNVVLAYMPGMGSNSAAAVAAGLRSSFPNINVAFVVGICGAVPTHATTKEEIILGDCIIGTEVIQYDFGRQYPDGRFEPKHAVESSLQRANPEIRAFMAKLSTSTNAWRLRIRLANHLETIQKSELKTTYPGAVRDRLFEADYLHNHRGKIRTCDQCLDTGVCRKDCIAIGCQPNHLVSRERLQSTAPVGSSTPRVHVGRFGSANTVMKSGNDRDRIAAAYQLTAFEMEVSGVYDILPTVVVKSACDYADSHKSKEWQDYAAATAAAGLKALLEQWEVASVSKQDLAIVTNLPNIRVAHFVSRPSIMNDIDAKLQLEGTPLVLLGMGGVGKSQLALDCCRRAVASGEYSTVGWVDASSPQAVESSLKVLVALLFNDSSVSNDVEILVSRITGELQRRGKKSLLVFDNFDDPGAFTERRLSWYFPKAEHGQILITSRHAGAARIGRRINISEMTGGESLDLLLLRPANDTQEKILGLQIAEQLGHLPLALDQARSYIQARYIELEDFLKHYKLRKRQILEELPPQWEYHKNTVGTTQDVLLSAFTTWELSFQQITGDELTRKAKETFLTLSAFFDRNSISRAYFKAYCDSTNQEWTRIFRTNGLWDDLKFDDIVAECRILSLVQSKQNTGTGMSGFTFHPIIQEWLKLRINREKQQLIAEEFTAMLESYFNSFDIFSAHSSLMSESIANVDACLLADGRFKGEKSGRTGYPIETARIFIGILKYTGRDKLAMDLAETAISMSKQQLNEGDPSVFAVMADLALSYSGFGLHKKALKHQKMVYDYIQSRFRQEELPANLAVTELAHSYRYSGMIDQARAILEGALSLSEKKSGPYYLGTLEFAIELGSLYSSIGMHEQAEPLYQRTMKGYEVEYGSTHPRTLDIMKTLGKHFLQLGQFQKSEELLQRALVAARTHLGDRNVVTLTIAYQLAQLFHLTNRLDEATALYRDVLNYAEEVLDAQDLLALGATYKLGYCLHKQGQNEEAVQLVQRALVGYEGRYGKEDKYVHEVAKRLAKIQQSLKN